MIQCGAPSLCGIKPGNMFTVNVDLYSEAKVRVWKSKYFRQGILIKSFRTSNNLMMIFTYNLIWIRKILGDILVQAYLKGKKYPVQKGTFAVLNELFYRLQTSQGFPHEVGIFLGYPLEDVINFEKNQGKNCKYCGYWKSYSNPEMAKICCCKYKNCSQMCKKWFDEGYSIPQIITKYKNETEIVA